MALSDENEVKVVKILGITPFQLEQQLAWLGTAFTSTQQSAVEDEIARWDDGAGTKFTRIEAKETNYGAVIDPEKAKNDIRKNIANILARPDWAGSSGNGARLQRA